MMSWAKSWKQSAGDSRFRLRSERSWVAYLEKHADALLKQRDAAYAVLREAREAIQDHAECFTGCPKCGWETANIDDDIVLFLSTIDRVLAEVEK